jgi:hypothetical protein
MRPVPRPVELRQFLGVDVQQRARLRPFKAAVALPRPRAAALRASVTSQHLPNRAAAIADQAREPSRPVVRALPRIKDALLDLRAQRPRATPRPRGSGAQTRQRGALGLRRHAPAMPPPMRRGRRNRTLSRRGAKRASPLDQPDQLQTARQSELASTVFHVRPLLRSCQSSRTNSLRTGPDNSSTVH